MLQNLTGHNPIFFSFTSLAPLSDSGHVKFDQITVMQNNIYKFPKESITARLTSLHPQVCSANGIDLL